MVADKFSVEVTAVGTPPTNVTGAATPWVRVMTRVTLCVSVFPLAFKLEVTVLRISLTVLVPGELEVVVAVLPAEEVLAPPPAILEAGCVGAIETTLGQTHIQSKLQAIQLGTLLSTRVVLHQTKSTSECQCFVGRKAALCAFQGHDSYN